MSKSMLRALVLLTGPLTASLALVACSDGHARMADEGADEAEATAASALGADGGIIRLPLAPVACPATRWISHSASATCSAPSTSPSGRWRATHLFDPASGVLPSASIPPGLNEYCSYDWVSPTGAAPDVNALPRAPRLTLAPDCMVISPLGASIDDDPAVWGALRSNALTQAGAVENMPPKTVGGTALQRVRVAVLDSAPSVPFDGLAGPVGTFAHGHNVGRVIRELACPHDGTDATTCIGLVSNHLALPLVTPTKEDRTNGGYFGRQSDVATAIHDALRPAPTGAAYTARVVLNMSLGWDSVPGYGGDFLVPDDLPPPARAVHAALVHASCVGALTFAAAGNRTNGDSATATHGAMYPAAWEAKRAPTIAECKDMEPMSFTPGPWLTSTTVQPLLYAVGGVDGRDAPLANGRETGRPRLNAYGFEVASSDKGGHTDPMTGTSMSTAVVSAAAAVVWGYKPALTPRQVVAALLDNAVPLTANPAADLCLTPPCGVARRVSLGAALTKVRCDVAACASDVFASVPAYAGKNPSWVTPWDSAVPGGVPSAGSATVCTNQADPLCVSPAATLKGKETTPWVLPQPWSSGCDVCGVAGSNLYVSMNPEMVGAAKSGYLTLYGNGVATSYAIPVPGVQTFSVANVNPPPGGATSATISFKVKTNGTSFSTYEPILTW